ncbi:hypothetical protein PRJ39_04600 [Lysobacter enzymogenes]|uniref:hypothetical protein n=1 Tax=Lysobacter enzymogenes TaxID=69 RepID=UPI0037486097
MSSSKSTEVQAHVVMFMAASALGTERATPPDVLSALLRASRPPQPEGGAVRAPEMPMSATALHAASPSTASAVSPITAACITLGDEQLASQELLDRLVKRLTPVLTREVSVANTASASSAIPPTLSAQSPLHADLQDRLKRQREVNRRLRSLLERVAV